MIFTLSASIIQARGMVPCLMEYTHVTLSPIFSDSFPTYDKFSNSGVRILDRHFPDKELAVLVRRFEKFEDKSDFSPSSLANGDNVLIVEDRRESKVSSTATLDVL